MTNDIPKTLGHSPAGPEPEAKPSSVITSPAAENRRLSLDAAAAERTRIAGLLHAGVLQELTIAALQLDALSRSLPAPANATASELAGLISRQQRAIREILTLADTQEGGAK